LTTPIWKYADAAERASRAALAFSGGDPAWSKNGSAAAFALCLAPAAPVDPLANPPTP
jgi:hypothetical protein